MGKGTKEWRNELTELINKGASAATIVEKIRSLAETSGDARTFEIFKNKAHFDSEELLKEYEKLRMGITDEVKKLESSFNLFAKYTEKKLKDVFGNIDVKNLTDEQQKQLKIHLDEFAVANELGENARKKLNELAKERWRIQFELDDREAQAGLTGWKKSLDEITGKAWTITIKTSDIKTVEDFFNAVKKEYKDSKSTIENYKRTIDKFTKEGKLKKVGDKYQMTGLVDPEELETLRQIISEFNAANEAMSKATGTAKKFNLELEKQKKEGKKEILLLTFGKTDCHCLNPPIPSSRI